MRLLDRYLLRELVVPFAYCLAGFFLFWNAFDLFGELDTFRERGLSLVDILEYYLLKTPEQLTVVLPVALLLALLYALSNHARYHELVAIRAAGVSISRLAAPYLAVGIGLSFLLFAINELWLPQSLEATERVLNRRLAAAPDPGQGSLETVHFVNQRDDRAWLIQGYNQLTCQMMRPHVTWKFPDGSRREFTADQAAWTAKGWVFTNAQEMVFSSQSEQIPIPQKSECRLMTELTETPQQIRSQIKIARMDSDNLKSARKTQLSIREILDYFKWNEVGRRMKAVLKTKLHGRIASPWTCLVVVLIALPFGTVSGRRSVYVGVASSIFICFIYFVLVQLGLALGGGGHLPPALAAWTPNLLFAATGIYLTSRNR